MYSTGPGDAEALPALPAPEHETPTQQAQADPAVPLPAQSPATASANGDTAVKAELSDDEDDGEQATAQLQVR